MLPVARVIGVGEPVLKAGLRLLLLAPLVQGADIAFEDGGEPFSIGPGRGCARFPTAFTPVAPASRPLGLLFLPGCFCSGFARCGRRGLAGMKIERDAVHAIAQPGRLRSVVEDMAEMAAAALAMHLGASHEKAAVALGFDRVFKRLVKARPAGAAVEFGRGLEQRLAAPGAMIDARIVVLVERAGAGALGAVLTQNPVLLRGSAAGAIPRR